MRAPADAVRVVCELPAEQRAQLRRLVEVVVAKLQKEVPPHRVALANDRLRLLGARPARVRARVKLRFFAKQERSGQAGRGRPRACFRTCAPWRSATTRARSACEQERAPAPELGGRFCLRRSRLETLCVLSQLRQKTTTKGRKASCIFLMRIRTHDRIAK
eukprot:6180213-Pleurochrysis_carterae.AAC.3